MAHLRHADCVDRLSRQGQSGKHRVALFRFAQEAWLARRELEE